MSDTNSSISRTRKEGRARGDAPKVTEPNLRFPAVFLPKSAVFCKNLLFSPKICAPPNAGISRRRGESLRKSAVFCENLRFGRSLSP